MEQELLRRVQMAQLEIAKEFKKICDENNLTYIMEGGTLLGAVRHEGFIPWDDDMDFSMPRKDYEKFFDIVSQMEQTKYKGIHWKYDKDYPHPFGKFVKRGTVYREEKMDKSFGIYIDVFPWDNWPDNEKGIYIYKFKLMVYRAMIRYKNGCMTYRTNGKINYVKLLKNLPFIILSYAYKRDSLVNKYDDLCQKYNNTMTSQMTCQCDMVPGKWNSPCNVFKDVAELKFEDCFFCAPRDYKGFLTRGYGDFMQLPPESKRNNQHLITEIDFGK